MESQKILVLLVGASYSLVMSGVATVGFFVVVALLGARPPEAAAPVLTAYGCAFLVVCAMGGVFLFRRFWSLPWRNALVGGLATAVLPCVLLFGGVVESVVGG